MKTKTFSAKGFGSACVHPQMNLHEPVNTHTEAIYPTTTYAYDDAKELMEIFEGKRKGYIYSRWHNPTVELAEKKIAALEAWNLTDENGSPLELTTKLFSSGMGAISALFLSCLKPGEKVLIQGTLYGGTNELLHDVLAPLNISPVLIELKNLDEAETALKNDKNIRMVYIETPANPTLDCYDIKSLCALAKKFNCVTAVDNTFATPYLQQPFSLGADFVLHSTTKFLNGHGTAIGGALVGRDKNFMQKKLQKVLKLIGASASPFDAWLLVQGMKTLELRMKRHSENAMMVAEFLSSHPKISRVNYCGQSSHPDYKLACAQMKNGFG